MGFWSGTSYTSLGAPDPMVAFAQSVGIKAMGGIYYFRIADGVDWASNLRVLDPSVARNGTPSSASALRLWAVSVKPRRFRAPSAGASTARAHAGVHGCASGSPRPPR